MTLSFIPKNRKPPGTTPGGSWIPKAKPQPQPESVNHPAPRDGFIPTTLKPVTEAPKAEPSREAAQLSLDSLQGARKAALDSLPPAVAEAVRHLWDVVGVDGSREHLLKLLEADTLAQQDQGQSVAESLRKLTDKPRGDGIDGESLTRQSIALLAEPSQFTHQGVNTYTCGAANLQYEMSEKPALLARFIEDVSDQDRRMEFPGEQVFIRPEKAELEDASGRSSLNRILQSTLMNFAGSQRGPYDPATDTFANGGHGLKILEVARTAALLDGTPKVVVHHNSDSHQEFQRIMKAAQPGETFQVGVSWNGQDHLLVYTGNHEGQAHYFNAQDAGTGHMPIDDFLFKTQFAVFPRSKIEGVKLPEDSVYYP
ncbi:MAG: hypothetical protein WC423_25790 [Vulcanimicrobiota bacterium]